MWMENFETLNLVSFEEDMNEIECENVVDDGKVVGIVVPFVDLAASAASLGLTALIAFVALIASGDEASASS